MSDSNNDDYDEKYTDPDLRREIKESLMESDKGGRPGQWSARKAQLLVQEYERRGGGYKKDRKDSDAQSLQRWTNQNWQTSDGSAYAEESGSMKRYLPEDAWDLLSDEEKQKAEKKKKRGDEEGRQFVENTIAAKAARAYVDHGDASELSAEQLKRLRKQELLEIARKHDLSGRSSMNKAELAQAIREMFQQQPEQMNRDELYEEAQQLDIEGRSQMDKSELKQAVLQQRTDEHSS